MKLLTQAIKRTMPELYSTEETPTADKKVRVKFFTPWTNWTWFAVEASAVTPKGEYLPLKAMDERRDIADVIFFGLVEGLETEWGYFSLNELQSVTGPFGLKVERDLYCGTPTMRTIRPNLFPADEDSHDEEA